MSTMGVRVGTMEEAGGGGAGGTGIRVGCCEGIVTTGNTDER
jgi:hypothetical protein